MFKITSDPTVYPYRECSLRDPQVSAKQLSTPAPGYLGTNSLFDRPDRRHNVIMGPRLSSMELALSLLDQEQVEALYEVTGMSGRGRQRSPILLFAAIDKQTVLSAPLTQTTNAYVYSKATDVWLIDAGTYTRANTAWYRDELNNLQGIVSGEPVFSPSTIANGMVMQSGTANLETPHPSSGDLVYTNTGGAWVWTTDNYSTKRSEGGSGKWTNANGDFLSTTFTTTLGATTSAIYYQVDMSGNGVVDFLLSNGGNSFALDGVVLSDRMAPIKIGPCPHDGATTSVTLTITASQSGGYTAVNYVGPLMATHEVANAFNNTLDEWTNIVTPAPDSLGYTASVGSADITVYATGTIPVRESQAHLWEMQDGADSWRLGWVETGCEFLADGHQNLISLAGSTWASIEGRRYMLIGRSKEGTVTTRLAWEEPGIDLGYVSIEATSASAGSIKAPSVSLHEVGGANSKFPVGSSTIENLHVLARPVDDEEFHLLNSLYLLHGWQNILYDAGYKLYEARGVSITPARNKPDFFNGVIALQEIAPVDGFSYSR